MSIERELLVRAKVLIECLDTSILQDQADIILSEIKKLLAQPEQTEQTEQTEQEPEAWIIVNRDTGYRIQVSLFPDLYNKDMFEVIPLYTAPPKREPLSDKQIEYYLERLGSNFKWDDGFKAGVEWAEKAHGIGVDNE